MNAKLAFKQVDVLSREAEVPEIDLNTLMIPWGTLMSINARKWGVTHVVEWSEHCFIDGLKMQTLMKGSTHVNE